MSFNPNHAQMIPGGAPMGFVPMAGSHVMPPSLLSMNTNATMRNTFRPPGKQRSHFIKRPPVPAEVPVTVFVGNIMEQASDMMIRQILSACGNVVSWKRVQAFGFCEFAGPEAGLRAVRLLHDRLIGEKRLVAKVDAKTQAVLDGYKDQRQKKLGEDATNADDNYLDDDWRDEDRMAVGKINQIIADFFQHMQVSSYDQTSSFDEPIAQKRKKNLDDAELEDGKRELITREIGKFREIMKKQEMDRELTKKQREKDKEKEREKEKERRQDRTSNDRSTSAEKEETKTRKRSRSRSREREKEKEREKEREQRERDREQRERERERERERDKERDRERERERERLREERNKSTAEILKEREVEEEQKERKKADRRAREKEAAYQERLRAWEARERRKAKEEIKNRERERVCEEEREKDAKRLKEFLEDYDDERDDVKYYKGRELQRRLSERVKEADADRRDRHKEKDELEELRSKVYASACDDPQLEFERLRKEREDMYKPKLLIDVNMELSQQRERERERELQRQLDRERDAKREEEREKMRQKERDDRERYLKEQAAQELAAVEAEPIDSDSDIGDGNRTPPTKPDKDPNWPRNNHDEDTRMSAVSSVNDTNDNSMGASPGFAPGFSPDNSSFAPEPIGEKLLSKPLITFSPTHALNKDKKKRMSDLKEVFNTNSDDEEEVPTGNKKRKLVPLDYDDKKSSKKDKKSGSSSNSVQADSTSSNSETAKIQEEKRKHIKAIIDKIPTDKNALFNYYLDRGQIDPVLMEKRIRPWINKKIIEYIGEPEPTLVDFICSKVLAGSQPQGILDDVQMVLDEEAEVFVVKMWRLIIYEVEAKKIGLVK